MNTIIPVTSEQLWGKNSEQHLLCPVAKKSIRSGPGSCQDTGLMGKPSLWPWACGNMKKRHRHSNCFTTITASHIPFANKTSVYNRKIRQFIFSEMHVLFGKCQCQLHPNGVFPKHVVSKESGVRTWVILESSKKLTK